MRITNFTILHTITHPQTFTMYKEQLFSFLYMYHEMIYSVDLTDRKCFRVYHFCRVYEFLKDRKRLECNEIGIYYRKCPK